MKQKFLAGVTYTEVKRDSFGQIPHVGVTFPAQGKYQAGWILTLIWDALPEPFEGIIALYRKLEEKEQKDLRRIASEFLVSRGATEVGSSDISHAIVSLHNIHGSFIAVFAENDAAGGNLYR